METLDATLRYAKNLITISKDAPISAAARMMVRHQVRHLPVIEEGKVVGIVSDRDVERAAITDFYSLGHLQVEERDFNPQHSVRHFMTYPVESVDASVSLSEVANRMIQKRISSLLVTSDGAALGIITTEDLLKILVHDYSNKPQPLAAIFSRWKSNVFRSPIGTLVEELATSGI